MKIIIGSDHAGYELKEKIKEHLSENGHEIVDKGTNSTKRTDYPLFAKSVAMEVSKGDSFGILVCGSGIGISIAANKVKKIRAVVCSEPYSAVLSRKHNNTNILALGSRVVGTELAMMIVDMWLSTEYEGDRHDKRVKMIEQIENEL